MKEYQSIIEALKMDHKDVVHKYLVNKGLCVKPYPDGFYYSLEVKPQTDEVIQEYLEAIGMSNQLESFEWLVLQCDVKFENCQLILDSGLWDLTFDEFIEIVSRL